MNDPARALAEAHWEWVEGLLRVMFDAGYLSHFESPEAFEGWLRVMRYNYITAMEHGYGHGVEDQQKKAPVVYVDKNETR